MVSFELRFHSGEKVFPCPVPFGYGGFGIEKEFYVGHGQAMIEGVMYRLETYSWYYASNPAIGCGACLCPTSEALGFHDHDVERVTVAYAMDTYLEDRAQPIKIYYGAHGTGQGMWVPWLACPKTKEGRVIIYVARGSHASYPSPGIKFRIFGFANDVCNNRGVRIAFDPNMSLVPAFDHRFPNGISLRSHIDVPPSQSITAWQRFLMPLWKPQN